MEEKNEAQCERVRLQKYISACGVMSRRAAEQRITEGRVSVNGETASLGCNCFYELCLVHNYNSFLFLDPD